MYIINWFSRDWTLKQDPMETIILCLATTATGLSSSCLEEHFTDVTIMQDYQLKNPRISLPISDLFYRFVFRSQILVLYSFVNLYSNYCKSFHPREEVIYFVDIIQMK